MKRIEKVCRENGCSRFERMGNSSTGINYLCLYADGFRKISKEEFEQQDVPGDCWFLEKHNV